MFTLTTRVTKSKEKMKESAREGVILSPMLRRFDKRLPEAPEVTSTLVETNTQGGGWELLIWPMRPSSDLLGIPIPAH